MIRLNVIYTMIMSLISLTTLSLTNIFALDTLITLTPEQINEVEENPLQIMSQCNNRIDLKYDAGNLCDAFSTYLKNKCDRLDNLGNYCGLVIIYSPKRVTQKSCLENFPLPNDTKGIKICLNYLSFNSTYSKLPLKFTLNHIAPDKEVIGIEFSVTNPTVSAIKLSDVYYTISKAGSKLITYILPSSYIIEPASIRNISDAESVYDDRVWNKVIGSSQPFVVNGTYRYSTAAATVDKPFNFTYP